MQIQTSSSFITWLSKPWLVVPLLVLAVLLGYGNSTDAPFYMDDFSSIQENPRIYNWPDRDLNTNLQALWEYAPLRIVGYLSFALNYAYSHFDTSSYHWVNIGVHSLVGLALFFLIRGLLQSPHVREQTTPLMWMGLPLFAALLFLLHPLHTQAVTYIVQRLASMAALFYLLSLLSFVQGRLRTGTKAATAWFVACGVFALLAFFTKQNTVTLPFALLLIEALFFTHQIKRFMLLSLGVFAALFGVWAILAFGFEYQPFSLKAMQAVTRETTTISRTEYLATQMTVLWTYIRLFIFPAGLHVDYDWLKLTGFADPKVLMALAAHVGVLLFAAFLLYKKQRLAAFALIFYYLAHSIESSLIPIRDVIFEHRAYLPDVGLAIFVAWLLTAVLPRWLHPQSLAVLAIMLVLALGSLTWQRNQVWRDPVSLWRGNTELAPNKARAWSILGKHYLQQKNPDEGVKALKHSLALQKTVNGSAVNTVDIVNLIVGLKMLKQYDKALQLTRSVLSQPIQPHLKAKFLINQSNIFYEQKRLKEAEASLREAIRVYPDSITARANLASIVGTMGRLDEAEVLYRQVLRLNPNNPVLQRNLQALQQLRQQQGQ